MNRMRSVQVSKPKGPLEIVEKGIPEPGGHQVRIKVQACGICHSDSVTKEGLLPGIEYPRVPGHEITDMNDWSQRSYFRSYRTISITGYPVERQF